MDKFADLRTEGRYVPAAEGVGANEIALNDLRRGMRVSDCGRARVQENHAVAVPRPRLGRRCECESVAVGLVKALGRVPAGFAIRIAIEPS